MSGSALTGTVRHAPTPPTTVVSRSEEDAFLRAQFRYHSRTFSLATRALPREVRLPIAALYYYCRTVDETADRQSFVSGVEEARESVARMRRNLDLTLAGRPPTGTPHDLLWHRLAEVHALFGLPAYPLHQLLDGADWDLDARPIDTEADLLAYSDLVAGSVGAVMLPFLVRQRTDLAALDTPARALGCAMQITNILRDVGEDARDLGRVYLPARALAPLGLDVDTLATAARGDGLPPAQRTGYAEVVERLMRRAERLYDEAIVGIGALRPAARVGIRSAARMYREILNRVREADYDNLTRRAVVPTGRKARAAFGGYPRRRARAVAG